MMDDAWVNSPEPVGGRAPVPEAAGVRRPE